MKARLPVQGAIIIERNPMKSRNTKVIPAAVSVCPIWTGAAAEKVGQMIHQIDQSTTLIQRVASTAQNKAIKGGFAAEAWHAETFNLDAILKDKDVRAFTDTFKNSPLPRNHTTHDIVVMKGDEQLLGAQLKYFKDAEATQKAFRSSKDGIHRYQNSDLFVGPSDQIDGIRQSAQHDVLKNQQTRPAVSEAAAKVRDKTAARIEVDGAASTPLSKRDAEQLGTGGADAKAAHRRMQDGYLNKATLQQSMRAAGSAALVTTVIAGSINTFQHLQHVRDGKITTEQAVHRILQNTVIAAGDAALKAGTATASVALATRAMPALFAGAGFTSVLARGGVAGAAVCVVDLVQCLVMVGVGRMTFAELETRTGTNILQTSAGVLGSSIGATLGMAGGPPGALVGGIVGGLIASVAMTIAVDNHVEKAFRLTLEGTREVVENGLSMQQSLELLQESQLFYADFHKGLVLSEKHFAGQVITLQAQSRQLREKLNRL